jgi:outer membrane protein OmpU
MGIMGGEAGVDNSNDQFVTRVDATFTMSGESDNGITFGASVDLDETDGATSNAFVEASQGGETIFISGDFGTLTMGDTDGALDKAVAETDLMGDIDDSSTGFSVKGMAFMDGLQDGQVARYDYSVAGFGLSVSAETPNTGDDRATFGLGATYTVALGGADLDLGLGYQGGEDAEGWGLSAGTTVAGVTMVANYAEMIANGAGADAVTKYYNIAATYSVDALTVGANYGEEHVDGVSTAKGFGLAAAYDLGGGLSVLAGYGENGDDTVGSFDDLSSSYSLGLKMAF